MGFDIREKSVNNCDKTSKSLCKICEESVPPPAHLPASTPHKTTDSNYSVQTADHKKKHRSITESDVVT